MSWKFSALEESTQNTDYDKEIVHNFITERELLHAIGGYGNSRTLKYYAYIGFVLALHMYLLAGVTITMCMPSTDKVTRIHACHTFLLVFFSGIGVFTRQFTRSYLENTMTLLKLGIYHYKNEEPNKEHLEIKKSHVDDIRTISKAFTTIVHLTALFCVICIPIVQLMFTEVKKYGEGLNPYLHRPFYMPFNTWTPLGFVIAFFFNACFYFYLAFRVACVNAIYMSCTLQLKAELEILNDSLRNIDRRAFLIYNKYVVNAYLDSSSNDLFRLEAYQKCLYDCLRSNIEHHQAILTLKKTFHPYTGVIVIEVIALASILFGANLFLMLEDKAFHQRIFAGALFVSGQIYVIRCTYYGELVLQKSSELYFSLYETPWMSCNVRFNRLLGIMMCYTRTPIKISSNIFNFTASLETFGEVASGIYKIMNLARQL